MTTWVSSSWWTGWVADCGAYTGPLPLPIPPAGVLGSYDEPVEIDFYVTDASASDVIAGTDAPPNNSSYQAWTSPTTKGSASSSSGTVTGTPHLFVIYYASGYTWPTSAPGVDALTFVPPSYAAGGTGPDVSGHWSDWITPDPYLFNSDIVSLIDHTQRLYFPSDVVGDTDAATLLASYVDTVQGGGGANSGGIFGTAPGFLYSAVKHTDAFGNVAVGGQAELTQYAVTLDGSGHDTDFDWFPDYLSTLLEGVDYAPRPDRSSGDDDYWVEYESGDVTVSAWQDWPLSTTQTDQTANTSDATVAFPASWTVRFAAIAAVDPVGDYWATYTEGTTLDTASVTVDTSTQNSGVQYDHTAAWAHTVAMGGVGAADSFTLLIQPSFLATDPSFWDFSPVVGDSVRWDYFSHLGIDESTLGTPPQVLWQAPRWRYWIPDNPLVWHTVGGHFATIGGAGLKILTPGVGWVPVVDGPA